MYKRQVYVCLSICLSVCLSVYLCTSTDSDSKPLLQLAHKVIHTQFTLHTVSKIGTILNGNNQNGCYLHLSLTGSQRLDLIQLVTWRLHFVVANCVTADVCETMAVPSADSIAAIDSGSS